MTNPRIQIFVQRTNARMTIKILKTGFIFKLLTPGTMIYSVAIKITLIKKKGIKMYQI